MAANIFDGSTDSNWGTATNWSLGTVPTASDGNVATFDATSPNCTVNASNRVCNAIDFTGYTNTITMTFNITSSGSITLGASMVISGTGSLTANATGTLTSAGKTWPNAFNLGGTSQTYTLADDWSVSGLLTFNGTTTTTINGAFTITGAAGLTHTSVAITSGTTNIKLTGGTWVSSGTAQLRNNLEIAGNVTIGNVAFNTGTLTRTSGIATIIGGTTLTSIGSTTWNVSGITWNNITMSTNSTHTLLGDLNLTGTLKCSNNITWSGAYNINTGNLSSLTSGGIMTLSGNINGTGTLQSGIATSTTFNGAFNINWTSGTITIGTSWLGTAVLNVSGTTNCNGATSASICSLTMNWTSGTITSTGFVYRTNVWTISSGVTCVMSGTHSFNNSATLTNNSTGLVFNQITNSSNPGVTATFNGTNGFTTGTLLLSVAGSTTNLKSGNTYIVTTALTSTASTSASRCEIRSSVGGSQAILTLSHGATQVNSFLNGTDIDSSLGQTIWTYLGTLSNTTNWNLLSVSAMQRNSPWIG